MDWRAEVNMRDRYKVRTVKLSNYNDEREHMYYTAGLAWTTLSHSPPAAHVTTYTQEMSANKLLIAS